LSLTDIADAGRSYAEDFKNRAGGYSFPEICLVDTWESLAYTNSFELTISLPVCNQEALIGSILNSLFSNIDVPSKLIILLDNCVDNTYGEVTNFLTSAEKKWSGVLQVLIFKTSQDIFESSCDNFALTLSNTRYFLSIQADNFLNDKTFIPRSISAMENYVDLAGISGRGIVPFDHPQRRPHKESMLRKVINLPSRLCPRIFRHTFLGRFSSKFQFFGDVSLPPLSRMLYLRRSKQKIFLGEAIIRGPIVWKTESLKRVGGFNDVAFFLGWDDYDLCFRLFTHAQLRVAFLPSSCYSLINTGTNSLPKSAETLIEYNNRELLAKKFPGEIQFYWNSHDIDSECKFNLWQKRKLPQNGGQ
jgi:hypothetical protein